MAHATSSYTPHGPGTVDPHAWLSSAFRIISRPEAIFGKREVDILHPPLISLTHRPQVEFAELRTSAVEIPAGASEVSLFDNISVSVDTIFRC